MIGQGYPNVLLNKKTKFSLPQTNIFNKNEILGVL
jgi:hypothetical protein